MEWSKHPCRGRHRGGGAATLLSPAWLGALAEVLTELEWLANPECLMGGLARPPLYRLIDVLTLGVSQFRNNIARKDLHLLGFIEDGV